MHGMAHDASCRNLGATAIRLTHRIPPPLAQTARQANTRTILDLLETWLSTATGFAGNLTKNAGAGKLTKIWTT